MDVNIVSGPTSASGPGKPVPARHAEHERAAQEVAATTAPRAGDFVEYLKSMKREVNSEPKIRPDPRPHTKPADAPKQLGKDLPEPVKFDVASDDVLARFWIDEASRRVVITMYQRDTGEIIRQTPPREVLDTVAALEGRGLVIDTTK